MIRIAVSVTPQRGVEIGAHRPPPSQGAHMIEVLREAELAHEELEALHTEGAIR